MRSIRYVLGGDPHNLDDCLDLLPREKPEEVSVELITNEIVAEMYILKQLIGRYNWKFTDRNVQYEEVYGGCFPHETEQRQKVSIDNANKRLNNSIRKIENMGIEVIGSDNSFEPRFGKLSCFMARIHFWTFFELCFHPKVQVKVAIFTPCSQKFAFCLD